ncbi:hypothetical protein NADFUDRAFT_83470 [Nadsonia fulvescens var. elongata DSM 6958]|uniref:Uncharacterized protein n=1 Tax=Nadsonia fulvescens var. elongata DSM 6958 TaxID=857566 RepID=A0A1E3PGP2_9ASCO|nr:hypothetical protein NADFUDRAFT_83470 [Nadsonia fulvescens var. elongata DSM 6958]
MGTTKDDGIGKSKKAPKKPSKRKDKKPDINGGTSDYIEPSKTDISSLRPIPTIKTSPPTPACSSNTTPLKSPQRSFSLDSDDDDTADFFHTAQNKGASKEKRLNELISELLPSLKGTSINRSASGVEVSTEKKSLPIVEKSPKHIIQEPPYDGNSLGDELTIRFQDNSDKSTLKNDNSGIMDTGLSVDIQNIYPAGFSMNTKSVDGADSMIHSPIEPVVSTETTPRSSNSMTSIFTEGLSESSKETFIVSKQSLTLTGITPRKRRVSDTHIHDFAPTPKRQEIDFDFNYRDAISTSTPIQDNDGKTHSAYFSTEHQTFSYSSRRNEHRPNTKYSSTFDNIKQFQQPSFDENFDENLFQSFIVASDENSNSPIYELGGDDRQLIFDDETTESISGDEWSSDYEAYEMDSQSKSGFVKNMMTGGLILIATTIGILAVRKILTPLLVKRGFSLDYQYLSFFQKLKDFFSFYYERESYGWKIWKPLVNSISQKFRNFSFSFLDLSKDFSLWLSDIYECKLHINSKENYIDHTYSRNFDHTSTKSFLTTIKSEYLKGKGREILSRFQPFNHQPVDMVNYVPEWYKKWEQEEYIRSTVTAIGLRN